MKTVLVVDDNLDHVGIVRRALEEAGLRVLCASSGDEAIKTVGEEKPDVVLLDLAMPGMSGWDVSRALRAMPRFAQTPIVAMTGHGQLEEKLRRPDSGFVACLIKPFTAAQVVDEIRSVLQP